LIGLVAGVFLPRETTFVTEPFRRSSKDRPNLACGLGAHFCSRTTPARLERRIALEEVQNRFPGRPDVDDDNAVWAHTSTGRGWEKLPVFTR
jgi:cytochrome P450